MKKLLWFAAVLGAVPAQAQSGPRMPDWLAGAWCTDAAKTDRTCEYWTPNSGGLMLGASIAMKAGKPVEYEQVRLATTDGVPVYFASHGGQPPVAFRAVTIEGLSITFANPGHDYPQLVRYWREGEELVAEISLSDGSNPMRWRYQRAGE